MTSLSFDIEPSPVAPEDKTAGVPGGFTEDAPTADAPYGYFKNGKPRKTPPGGGGTRLARPSNAKGNEKLAEDAAAVLCNLNQAVGLGASVFGFFQTASALNVANEGFRSQAIAALENDPALCRQILKAGTTGGKMALVLAYGMLAVAVAPVTISELRARAEARESLESEGEGTR